MIPLVRVARVVVTLVLAVIAVSAVIGVARPETGLLEKGSLLLLLAGCIFLAARIPTWATRVQAKLRDRGQTQPSVG